LDKILGPVTFNELASFVLNQMLQGVAHDTTTEQPMNDRQRIYQDLVSEHQCDG
jgi:hypothetical protein